MLYYYTKRKNNYVIYQNELYILRGVNWHWRGLVLLIKDRNNTDNQVQTNFSQIKPYYTSHELLIKKGYQYITDKDYLVELICSYCPLYIRQK